MYLMSSVARQHLKTLRPWRNLHVHVSQAEHTGARSFAFRCIMCIGTRF